MADLVLEMCRKAKQASVLLAQLTTETKNKALYNMADALEKDAKAIIEANEKDMEA